MDLRRICATNHCHGALLHEPLRNDERSPRIRFAFSRLSLLGADGRAVDDGFWNYVHRWTLSRHLWEADSSLEFACIWKEKPHFVITNYSFEPFLECGRGEDVDEFAEILLKV